MGGRDFNNLEDSLCLSLADASASLSRCSLLSLGVSLILPVTVRWPVWLAGKFVLFSRVLLVIGLVSEVVGSYGDAWTCRQASQLGVCWLA